MSELKSKHLWPGVEDFTRPKIDDHEEGNDMNTPDWVARAMLDDLRMLEAERDRLRAELVKCKQVATALAMLTGDDEGEDDNE